MSYTPCNHLFGEICIGLDCNINGCVNLKNVLKDGESELNPEELADAIKQLKENKAHDMTELKQRVGVKDAKINPKENKGLKIGSYNSKSGKGGKYSKKYKK